MVIVTLFRAKRQWVKNKRTHVNTFKMQLSLTQVTSYGFLVFPTGLYKNRARTFYRHSELTISATYTLQNNEVSQLTLLITLFRMQIC